jgi:hypothetical protein
VAGFKIWSQWNVKTNARQNSSRVVYTTFGILSDVRRERETKKLLLPFKNTAAAGSKDGWIGEEPNNKAVGNVEIWVQVSKGAAVATRFLYFQQKQTCACNLLLNLHTQSLNCKGVVKILDI